jgi:2-methylcitrate dehydratase
MKKITVTEDREFNERYPDSLPCRITITLKSGERRTAEIANPIGHHDRPMTDEQVVEKFRGLGGRKLPPDRLQKVLACIWSIDRGGDLRSLFDMLEIGVTPARAR